MTTRPGFWMALVVLSLASAIGAWWYFPHAFSIVSLDISMTREQALAEARVLAERDGLGPAVFRQAASFSLDTTAQTFVELEGGGKDAFTAMLREGLYEAYSWRVRHFAAGEANEVTIRFTPDGRPYGFVERLAEDAPGPALGEPAARAIAEAGAVSGWRADLAPFVLVEHAEARRPSDRVDHTFTYERPAPRPGDGRYRLRLVVSGDRLTEVTHFIDIPEAFTRRYAEMRSANDTIGIGAVVGLALFYVLGGIGIGLFFLLRQRFVLWRPALYWGVAVAGFQLLAGLNSLPLAWMSYDTALPYGTFLTQQIVTLVGAFIGFAGFFALSFMAAESLTRRAFGTHPQFWRLWSRDPGSSTAVLGRTAAGYLLVSVFLFYDVALYLLATRYLGWWTPSETLIQPDVLATYVPWLGAIANSLQAGFWEECLFRAVPLAGAALIGRRFGRPTLFLVVAFILQAAIFGAGHAPYPTQPSFARPVELILPSIGFGLLYLWFGLLPAIVLHFAFDVVWFAVPIFVADAPGQQAMVIVMTLVPLWVVLWRRVQAGRWTTLADADRNAAWTPPAVDHRADEAGAVPVFTLRPAVRATWLGLGVAGLVVAGALAVVDRDRGSLTVGRAAAAELARQELASRGVTIDAGWRVMPVPENGDGVSHEFVADTAGEARRRELVGEYLPRPRWRVRIATFEGDVAERAEEWVVYVWAQDDVGFVTHTLPEARPGAALDEDAARALAYRAVAERGGLEPDDLREVSATPHALSARTDWTFVFEDITVTPPLPQGEPRYQVRIAGDEVASASRTLHIPEEWSRARRSTATRNNVIGIAAVFLLASVLVAAAVGGVVSWSRGRYSPRLFVIATGLMLAVSGLSAANAWPTTVAAFLTEQPFELQLFAIAGAGVVGLAGLSALIGLALGALPGRLAGSRQLPEREALSMGAAIGLVGAGAAALASWFLTPDWARHPDVAPMGSVVPIAALALGPIASVLTRAAIVVTAIAFVHHLSRGWTRQRVMAAVLLFVLGVLATGGPVGPSVGPFLAAGAVLGASLLAAYLTVLRADLTVLPLAIGVMAAFGAMRGGLAQPFPGALVGSLLGAALALLAGWWLFRAIRRPG
jgi:hypothetical protein